MARRGVTCAASGLPGRGRRDKSPKLSRQGASGGASGGAEADRAVAERGASVGGEGALRSVSRLAGRAGLRLGSPACREATCVLFLTPVREGPPKDFRQSFAVCRNSSRGCVIFKHQMTIGAFCCRIARVHKVRVGLSPFFTPFWSCGGDCMAAALKDRYRLRHRQGLRQGCTGCARLRQAVLQGGPRGPRGPACG